MLDVHTANSQRDLFPSIPLMIRDGEFLKVAFPKVPS
jgi:hypothetical protein